MPKIKTGYSKNIMAHGKCRILHRHLTEFLIVPITGITRPDGTKWYVSGEMALVNKDEVSNIKGEEI